MLGMKRGERITRYYPNNYLRGKCDDGNQGEGKRTLAISRSAPFCVTLGLGKSDISETVYPDVNMLSLPYEDDSFDYVVSEYVIEHVEGDIFCAIDECKRVLKPGGVAVHLTNFMYPIHGVPYDYWRYTPSALKLLHKNWSEILEVGGWGNHYLMLLRVVDLFYVKVPECRFHPINWIANRNDPDFPMATWIIVRK